jgi:hypothetical protein
MPDVFVLQATEKPPNYRPSSAIIDEDRYTSMPYEKPNEQKSEIYHVGGKNGNEPTHDQEPYKSSSSPINNFDRESRNRPELYHLKPADDDDNIPNRDPSPSVINSNRISSTPFQNSTKQGVEMYYVQAENNNSRQSSPVNKTKFNDDIAHDDDHDQRKVTMFMLTTTDQENVAPASRIQRTPSPPVS